MAEEGELDIDQTITIQEYDLNDRFGNLASNTGSTYTLQQLLKLTIQESDNTAAKAIRRHVPEEKLIEAFLSMGLPISSITSDENPELSPKQLSYLFRTLYYSTFLNRQNSQWILHYLTETEFKDWIQEGVPKHTRVAHKFGNWQNTNSIHDCGIVYHPQRDYILCIMSKNTTPGEAKTLIPQISKTIYNYITELPKKNN